MKTAVENMENEVRQKCLSLLEKTEYYDDEGEWRIAGSDWLLIGGDSLRNLARETEQVLGEGARTIMHVAGKRSGEQFSRALLKKGIKNEGLKFALETFLTNSGWGKVSAQVNFQKREATVKIRNSIMARETKEEKPVCHFINGYIAGVFCMMFGSGKIDSEETKCTTKGDSFCEFSVHEYCKSESSH